MILGLEQTEILEKHFQENPNWTNKEIMSLSKQFNTPSKKIYKWNWDRKKKELEKQQFWITSCKGDHRFRKQSTV